MKITPKPTPWFAVTGLSLVLLSGCSALDEFTGKQESVDYKSTVSGDPLSIPPDLTQANRDARFQAPARGAMSYSEYAESQAESNTVTQNSRVLPSADGIQVKRDGELRWLTVDQPAEVIYPRVIEFWNEQGFTIQSDDPRAGLIATDWAENRSKIPDSWIRSLLGSVIDQVFDSGERERFRTRLERVDGKTEVYISHQHMYETPTTDGAAFKWVHGKEDQGLNAVMLARLMVFLGTDLEQAQAQVKAAEADTAEPLVQVQDTSNNRQLTLNEGFDRAWRRVGVAIDSAGFSVEDRDRSAGEYYIRYLDADSGEKIEQPNIIGRLFRARNTAEAQRLRIRVQAQGAASTVVQVVDEQGQVSNTATAGRIINVLSSHMAP
ncbi:outer membrane protein assembly factor BamC [Paenalcaligenes hominis]|uniref:Outer membrane protein assembly factor BamC n=1 Tax=Paenalcaligenes hominis TaxID=643674 RepID=A0ABX0WQM7_9BURK|nr:outer membrane protein assembly factor BamC [Paenalcaligenes hominis]NJB64637.1 outer membrane protein assembly factor BamC [Paenalcaligenes hominis]GGE60194.1 lipoprotein [Paenalcaligenes hominis]